LWGFVRHTPKPPPVEDLHSRLVSTSSPDLLFLSMVSQGFIPMSTYQCRSFLFDGLAFGLSFISYAVVVLIHPSNSFYPLKAFSLHTGLPSGRHGNEHLFFSRRIASWFVILLFPDLLSSRYSRSFFIGELSPHLSAISFFWGSQICFSLRG